MSAIWQVRLNPLLKVLLCLSGVVSIVVGGYFLIKHFEALPSAVKWIVILLHPVPFILMKLLLVRAFYFFEIFSERCSTPFRENAAELQHLKRAGKPFALYLRNHSFENKATIESFPVRPDAEIQPRDGLIHLPVPRNHFEISLVKKLANCLPVFAIESPDDVTLGAARRVLVDKQDWFDLVSGLIPHARLLIVNYEQSTAGIKRELECVAANERQGRVLLFVKESCLTELKDKYPKFLKGIWRVVLKKGHSTNDRLEDAEVPEDVLLDLGCKQSVSST